jgi:hypothetical protein
MASDWGIQGLVLLIVVIMSGLISLCAVVRIPKKANLEEPIAEESQQSEPEKQKPQTSCLYWSSVAIVFLLFVVSGLCLFASIFAGDVLKHIIETYDVAFLGVQVQLDQLEVYPFTGIVSAGGLTIFNPPGWETSHLLSASSIYLNLNIASLLSSLGSNIDVEDLSVSGVDVVFEKSLHTSNVYEVLEHVREGLRTNSSHMTNATEESGSFSLHKVDIQNITATAALYGFGGVNIVLPNITENDFEKKLHGEDRAFFAIDLILDLVLTNVLRGLRFSLGADMVIMPEDV